MDIIADLRHVNLRNRPNKIRPSQYYFLTLSDFEFKRQFRFSKMNVKRLTKLLGEITYYFIFLNPF